MWYRDYTLVRQHVEEIEREIRAAASRATLLSPDLPPAPRDGLRARSAAAVRLIARGPQAIAGRLASGRPDHVADCAPAATTLAPRHHS